MAVIDFHLRGFPIFIAILLITFITVKVIRWCHQYTNPDGSVPANDEFIFSAENPAYDEEDGLSLDDYLMAIQVSREIVIV